MNIIFYTINMSEITEFKTNYLLKNWTVNLPDQIKGLKKYGNDENFRKCYKACYEYGVKNGGGIWYVKMEKMYGKTLGDLTKAEYKAYDMAREDVGDYFYYTTGHYPKDLDKTDN